MTQTEVQNPPIKSLYCLREGLNKNINKFGGIFHRGWTPPLPFGGKLLRKMFSFYKCLQQVLNGLKHVLYDTGNSEKFLPRHKEYLLMCTNLNEV